MVGLGDLSGGTFISDARGVSYDGSVVVGAGTSGVGSEAYRWTASGGMVSLGSGLANSVSGDGSTVVGGGPGTEAYRWTADTGWLSLGFSPSRARDVSYDGSVIVGYTTTASGGQAYSWTVSGGMEGLGVLPGRYSSQALGVSGDGSVIVGTSNSASGTEAFRWDSGGMLGLGDLPDGSFYSEAMAISGDGSVVVGWGKSGVGDEAVLWTADKGMVNFKDMLEDDYGLDLTGWNLSKAYDISDNGLTIVGSGINPSGQGEAWIATIPEPSTICLLSFGTLALLRKRRV